MNETKLNQIYNLLAVKGYNFKKKKNNSAKFKNYGEAFNASMDISNSFISASSGQDNKILYFGDYIALPELTEDDLVYKETKYTPSYEGIMMSFSFYLSELTDIEFVYKIKKRDIKEIIIGDVEIIYNEFEKVNPNQNLVKVTKKKDRIIFESIKQ